MHRHGHLGIVLLTLAPVLYGLLEVGRPFFALLAWGVLVIEPLPDYDLRTSLLSHRGTSHSFFAAGIVGLVCAGIGWAVGTYVTLPVSRWFVETVLIDPGAIAWAESHLLTLDGGFLAFVGFFVGSGGICLHLLGDMITVYRIQPFSRRRISLSSLRAKNPYVNSGLFALGILALLAVGVFSTPLGGVLVSLLGRL